MPIRFAKQARLGRCAIVFDRIESPLGTLTALAREGCIVGLYLPHHQGFDGPQEDWERDRAPFAELCGQLSEYFAGRRRHFDLPLELAGTPFQQQTWRGLTQIPFGQTVTYGELAARLGRPSASRAVGAANGRNPVSILVPCHRVVGASGKLTGYAGGVEKKNWLLELERSVLA